MQHYRRYYTEMPYYDKNKKFYVCSYGGSGSKMLCQYLGYFGDVYHLHSRCPPSELTKTGYDDQSTYVEWFNTTTLTDNEIKNYKVIFIYRDPLRSIYSRYNNESILKNVQAPFPNATLKEVVEQKKDLFGIEDFFDHYTKVQLKNYPIYCIKYELLWDHFPLFNTLMNIPDLPERYPRKYEMNREEVHNEELSDIYKSLRKKMDAMKFLEIR
jgi:hypothetical protein